MIKPSFKQVRSKMEQKGYKFFTGIDSINIVGIRTLSSKNEFDDVICVLWYSPGMVENIEYFPCTTKPGRHWLLSPLHSKGTAILMEGQYRGAYKIGIHNRSRPSRSYTALEQKVPMRYYRDNDLDGEHDYTGTIWQGNFKTNIHRASTKWMSKFVDKWSAGCQVITGPDNWQRFLEICEFSVKKYGNSLTYTLLNKNDFT